MYSLRMMAAQQQLLLSPKTRVERGAQAVKTSFDPGESIRLYMSVLHSFEGNINALFEWQVTDTNGVVVPELSYTCGCESGAQDLFISKSIPPNLPSGTYTFRGSVTYDGQVSSRTTTFTVTNTTLPLITNGDFSDGENGWGFFGDITHTVSGGTLNVRRSNPTGWALLTNFVGSRAALPANVPVEVTLKLGNSSASPKNVTLMLQNLDASYNPVAGQQLYCAFTIPANTALQTYTLRGLPTAQWSRTDFRLWLDDFNEASLLVDDVSVAVRDDITVTQTSCTQPATPADKALQVNGQFSSGEAVWSFFGDITHTVSGGTLNVQRSNPASWALVAQLTRFGVPANAPLEWSLDFGNSSSTPKNVTMILRNFGGSGDLFCAFTIPANSALQTYTLRGKTAAAWGQIDSQVFIDDFNTAGLQVDNALLRYRPSLNPTGTECTQPATPAETNLLPNGDFGGGEAFWGFFGSINHSVSSGALNVQRTSWTPPMTGR